jgi:hypothetical protein
MSKRRTALGDLYEELRTIEVFDRIWEYAPLTDPADGHLYARRQVRRKQIMDEIASLKAYKFELWRPARLSGAIAIMCAAGYFMIYYSLK